jgi:type III pantothenate kinase
MILLVDVGNTRAKWAVLADGRLSGSGAVLHRGVPAADWVHGLEGASAGCERILVSNVAGPAVAHAIGEWALSHHGFRPEFVRATREAGGIRNVYEHPEALGPDRWCGMIGAWRRVRGPLVCIAAGTAMTIDAVDTAGTHLGGLIVPGHDLMIDSLLRRTSDIAPAAQLAPPAGSGMLGRNTAAAIELGASHALAALALRSIDWVSRLVGTPPRVFLGGGDATRIEPLLGVGVELASGLVLEGLAAIAEGDG